jgi:hypothetical protein
VNPIFFWVKRSCGTRSLSSANASYLVIPGLYFFIGLQQLRRRFSHYSIGRASKDQRVAADIEPPSPAAISPL